MKSRNGESIHGFYLQMGKEYLKGRGCGTCKESLLRERRREGGERESVCVL